ncbi:polyadenylate-binding protein RBP45-like [Silene latifolia]|uniref:polyadenylate-binding protein RBP45-like n=1 Tax=Silene latifolia TaxID=37657 RepID=UPI003D785F01
MTHQPPQQPPSSMDPQQYQQYQQYMWAQQQQPPPQQQPQQMWLQQQQYQQQPPQQYQQQPQPQQYQQQPQPQQQQPQYQQYQQQQPPQQQYQQQEQQPQQPATAVSEDVCTLWIGDLQYWMDESYISKCFCLTGELVSVKIIRNKQTKQSEGYGFIEFNSHVAADRMLKTYNGTSMPGVEQNFRLNWASYGSGEKRSDDTVDHTIFVGDLSHDVTDYGLQEAFRAHYPSVKGAKVVMDKLTGRPKGYGFVHFRDESEQLRAMSEMNGVMCAGRPMRIGPATCKKTVGGTSSYQNSQGAQNDSDPNNTTIFVGNLDCNVTDEYLRQAFSQYGELVHIKIPVGKQCGFVEFTTRNSAEAALAGMNGVQLGERNVRLSWGHNTTNRKPQAEQNQYNNAGYYGYPQGYDPYAYAAAPQDPNMYYGAYPGYGGYPVPQQGQQPVQHQQ